MSLSNAYGLQQSREVRAGGPLGLVPTPTAWLLSPVGMIAGTLGTTIQSSFSVSLSAREYANLSRTYAGASRLHPAFTLDMGWRFRQR